MPAWWRSMFARTADARPDAIDVVRLRDDYEQLDDARLHALTRNLTGDSTDAASLAQTIAATAVVAERRLGLRLFGVQLAAAMALAQGKVVEMQTGEGKTLAAAPAI